MASLLVEQDRTALLRRIAALTPASPRRWGRMSVDAMVCHLGESARMALGDLPTVSKSKRAFQTFPLKHLILYVVPFPKGAPTAPELIAAQPQAFEAERARLLELLARLVERGGDGAGPAHPLFGPLSYAEWGVATYKHSDHHLKQFSA